MKILTPTTLVEALAARTDEPETVPLAGGTDLMVAWHAGADPPKAVLALSRVTELREIRATKERIEIGAAVPHAAIASDERVRKELPALAAAASSIGAPAIRNMGTLAGNLVTASPAADLPPALLVYDAVVCLASARGQREVPVDRFFTGYREVDLQPDELLISVAIPYPPQGSFSRYHKIGTRRAQSCAKLSLAGRIEVRNGAVEQVRLASGSVAEVPMRLADAERAIANRALDTTLAGEAAAAAAASVAPVDDVRSTAAYRRAVLGRLVERLIQEAANRFGGE